MTCSNVHYAACFCLNFILLIWNSKVSIHFSLFHSINEVYKLLQIISAEITYTKVKRLISSHYKHILIFNIIFELGFYIFTVF